MHEDTPRSSRARSTGPVLRFPPSLRAGRHAAPGSSWMQLEKAHVRPSGSKLEAARWRQGSSLRVGKPTPAHSSMDVHRLPRPSFSRARAEPWLPGRRARRKCEERRRRYARPARLVEWAKGARAEHPTRAEPSGAAGTRRQALPAQPARGREGRCARDGARAQVRDREGAGSSCGRSLPSRNFFASVFAPADSLGARVRRSGL